MPFQKQHFAVLRVQFGSVQLRGIGANFALKRTRREHIVFLFRNVGLSRRLLASHGTGSIRLSVSSSHFHLSGSLRAIVRRSPENGGDPISVCGTSIAKPVVLDRL